jgi:hypothetical protein
MPIRDNSVFQRDDVKKRLAILKTGKIGKNEYVNDRYGRPIVEFTDDELLGILDERDRNSVLRLQQLEEFAKPCIFTLKTMGGLFGDGNKYRITMRSDRTGKWDTQDFPCSEINDAKNPQLELLEIVHKMKLKLGEDSEMPKVVKKETSESKKNTPDCPVHKVGMVWNPAIAHFVCPAEDCKVVAKPKTKPEPVTPADVSNDLDDVTLLPTGPVKVVVRRVGNQDQILLEQGGVYIDVSNFVTDVKTTQELIDVSSFTSKLAIPGRSTMKLTLEFLA